MATPMEKPAGQILAHPPVHRRQSLHRTVTGGSFKRNLDHNDKDVSVRSVSIPNNRSSLDLGEIPFYSTVEVMQ